MKLVMTKFWTFCVMPNQSGALAGVLLFIAPVSKSF